MEKRGEEEEERDGSLHPLEFSKVGAYGSLYLYRDLNRSDRSANSEHPCRLTNREIIFEEFQ